MNQDGSVTNFGIASMMHEMMHKFGMDDFKLGDAVGGSWGSIAKAGDTSATSMAILEKCFP
jgi:hypothetical protein